MPLVFLHGVKTRNLAAKVRRSYPTQVLPLPGGDERLAAEVATLLDQAATAGYRVDATPLNRFRREQGEQILAGLPEARAAESVAQLRTLQRLYQRTGGDAPFRPHRIARHRQSAYMVKAVTAYLDNLIDWGDGLFRRDTDENVNEATRIYTRSRSRNRNIERVTGKTLAAEVIAGDELYAVDLGTMVDKYIGETEKNLRRIFDEAEATGDVLFFEEADALMTRRSEVRDAHDRYANIEVSYLLQLMESYDGTAILATNLKANLDEAFSLRFHYAVEFPLPDASQRPEPRRRSIPDEAPLGDLDIGFLAERIELAVGREYLKFGKIISQTEFAEWYPRVLGRLRDAP